MPCVDCNKNGSIVVKLPIELPRKEIEAFCCRWEVSELSLFGSVLTAYFNKDFDIDVLVKFVDSSRRTLLDVARMEREMVSIFHRKVDLVLKGGIEASKNTIRRDEILNSAVVIYNEEAA